MKTNVNIFNALNESFNEEISPKVIIKTIENAFDGTDFTVGNISIEDNKAKISITAFGPDGKEMSREITLDLPEKGTREDIFEIVDNWIADHNSPDLFFEGEEEDKAEAETIANIAKLADIDKKDEKAYYLAGQLMNYYGSDMGTYFDEIQGNEEERFNEIYGMLYNKEENKETLNKILDELKNSEWIDQDDASAFGVDKDLAKTLEEYLNEGCNTIKEEKIDEEKINEEEQINEEETVIVNGNNEEQDIDYIITDVTVLNPVGDGDVQAPDIDALLTLVDESLKADYGDWGHIKVLSSRIDENSCFALVDISTKEIMKEFEDKGITDVAIGKNLIIESAGNLYDFKVNSLSGITKFSKKTNDALATIKEWVETEFLSEAKEEKKKAEELEKAAEQKEVTEQYINNRADLRQEIENIKMFIELSKQAKAAEEMKPSIQKRMYAFAAELPANIEVDEKKGLKFNSRDDIVEIIFGKEWVEETREDNEVVGVIKEEENLNESYSQFNIGEIEVVFNPDTYECLYSIPSAEVQDKKINLTKIPSVDTPYDTDTIIKSFIETKFGVIPTEEEQKEVETTTEPEASIEEPIDDTVDTGVEIEDEPVEEAELPEEPTEGEPEPTEEEIPQNETGTAQFYKIRPKNPITLEEIVTSDKEPEATSYIVIEEKLLNDDEWNDLVSDITKPQSYLENIQSIDRKNYAFNVIKLTNSNAGYSVLVDPLGYNYPRYLAVIE